MVKNKQNFIISLVVIAGFFCLSNLFNSNLAPEYGYQEIPYFSSKILGEESQTLDKEDLKGKKIFLNFFASWCKVCVKEHKALVEIAKNLDIPIYGVVLRDNYSNIERIIRHFGNPYEAIIEADPELLIGLNVRALPSLYLLDENTVVLSHYIGEISPRIFHKKFDKYIKH